LAAHIMKFFLKFLNGGKKCTNGVWQVRRKKPRMTRFLEPWGGWTGCRWEIQPWYEASGEIGGIILFSEVITERKQMEETLRESEEKFAILFRSSPDPILLTAISDGRVIEANDSIYRITGYIPEEVIGRTNLEIGWWVDPADHGRYIEMLQKQGRVVGMEAAFRAKSGEIRIGQLSGELIDIQGSKYILSVFRDITERRQMEEALSEKDGLLTESQQIAHIGSWRYDMEGRITWSDETYHIYGVSQDTFIPNAETFINLIHPDDRSAMQAWINACMSGEKPGELEFRTVLPDGSIRFISGRGDLKHNTVNRLIYMAGTAQDITERRQADDALLKSETLYRSLVEHLPQLIFIKDRNSVYISCNAKYAHSLGIKPEEIVGKDDSAFYPRELAEKYRADDRTVIDTGTLKDIEEKYLVEGAERWVHTIKLPYRDEHGNIIGVLGIFEDITEHKKVEVALLESEERYRQLLEVAPVGIAVHRKDKLLFINRTGARMLGASSLQELAGKPISEIVHPEGWEAARDRIRRMLEGEQGLYPVEDKYIRLDGTVFPVEVVATSLTYEGKPAIQIIVLDITERRHMEEERRENVQKLIKAMESTIEAMAVTVEMRDPYTAGHQRRVTILASAIAREMCLSEDQVYGINLTGIVHDIGKISVPAEILSKPGRLSEIELKLIKMHPRLVTIY